jgi:hypothetical protein
VLLKRKRLSASPRTVASACGSRICEAERSSKQVRSGTATSVSSASMVIAVALSMRIGMHAPGSH